MTDVKAIPEDSVEDCGGRPNTYHKEKKLSTVSVMYDRNGKGYLDKTEQQMRNMDVEGTGNLANDAVYELVQSHLEAQRQLFRLKRVLCGVALFALLLAITTLATSFAAANLAKESNVVGRTDFVTGEDELLSKDGSKAIGVHTIGHEIVLDEHDDGDGVIHVCVDSKNVEDIWNEIASEHEVQFVLKRKTLSETASKLEQMANENLIPLTGTKIVQGDVCFTSFNEVAVCTDFNDTHCKEESDSADLIALNFPNTDLL